MPADISGYRSTAAVGIYIVVHFQTRTPSLSAFQLVCGSHPQGFFFFIFKSSYCQYHKCQHSRSHKRREIQPCSPRRPYLIIWVHFPRSERVSVKMQMSKYCRAASSRQTQLPAGYHSRTFSIEKNSQNYFCRWPELKWRTHVDLAVFLPMAQKTN